MPINTDRELIVAMEMLRRAEQTQKRLEEGLYADDEISRQLAVDSTNRTIKRFTKEIADFHAQAAQTHKAA